MSEVREARSPAAAREPGAARKIDATRERDATREPGAAPGKSAARSWHIRFALPALGLLLALAVLPAAAASDDAPPATAQVVLTDRWDMPIALNMIPAGEPTLLLVCDPTQVKSREGAVFFDTQRQRIEAAGVRPACVLVAAPEAAREAAEKMALTVPVYVDAAWAVPARVVGQDVTPALVLLDGDGNVKKVAVGGGETLDANITAMLEPRNGRWKTLTLLTLAALGIILLVVS